MRGLRKAYADVVAVDGIDLAARSGAGSVQCSACAGKADAAELRQRLGVQLQETQLSGMLTVEETVRLFRSFYRIGPFKTVKSKELG